MILVNHVHEVEPVEPVQPARADKERATSSSKEPVAHRSRMQLWEREKEYDGTAEMPGIPGMLWLCYNAGVYGAAGPGGRGAVLGWAGEAEAGQGA